ncbi:MAG: hypothetical protein ABSD08_20460 [Xanthobacteraceae bacterium]
MRKLTLTLTAAALALGTMTLTASAQTQHPGVAGLHAQSQNFTPIIEKAACNGWTGSMGCGPGWIWSRYRGRCVRC